MTDLLRQEIAAAADLLVVKVGTRVLTDDAGQLDLDRIAQLAEQLSRLIDSGRKVVLISSGAVGAGMGKLGQTTRPTNLAMLQAVAAVGQSFLVQAYDRALQNHNRHAAQVLLTVEDFDDRTRYLNVRNTLLTLLELGAVPIINENDTVSVEELQTTFGDNDHLAALVTNLLQAPLLVLLSDVEGLYDGDPQDAGAKIISTVTTIDQQIDALVYDTKTGHSKGGMASKLAAAKMVTAAGENVVIASGRRPGVLEEIITGQPTGTLFLAQGKTISPRKRWIAFTVKPRGSLIVDAGARRAIEQNGRSLLAIGLREIQGQFTKGDVVAICDEQGAEFARGLTNYPSKEIERIKGLQSDQIAKTLGHCPYEEVIHRDNLSLRT
jgi:glutamate 5-kinase